MRSFLFDLYCKKGLMTPVKQELSVLIFYAIKDLP